MKLSKPDRFERMVLATLRRHDRKHGGIAIWLTAPDIVRLLRRQYAAIQREIQECGPAVRFIDRDDLLAHLDRWRQCK